jgi:hypothetical protein
MRSLILTCQPVTWTSSMSSRSRAWRWVWSSWSMTAQTRPAKCSTPWRSRLPLRGRRAGLRGWRVLLGVALACGDRGGAALQGGHADQRGLVEVDQPVVLAAGGLEPAVQAGELGGEQLVVGDGACTAMACSPASSRPGSSRAARIWAKTNSSRASARMLRSGRRLGGHDGDPVGAQAGSWRSRRRHRTASEPGRSRPGPGYCRWSSRWCPVASSRRSLTGRSAAG